MKDRKQTSGARSETLSRRRFVGRTAAGAAAFSLVPRHVLGGAGQVPPSEKLNLAFIGLGGQGTSLTRRFTDHNYVAFCDVDDKRAARAYKRFPNAKPYRDFRRLLETEKNIDGVVVATTDSLHAPISMMALKMGKHVYCEKPLTHTIHEARQLAIAAREAKVATQMGNSGQASEGARRSAAYAKSTSGLTDRSTGGRRASGVPRVSRPFRIRSIGISGSARRRSGPTIQSIYHLFGVDGGTSAPAPSGTSGATPSPRSFGP